MSDARTERIDAAVGAGGELVGCLLQEGPVTPGQARLIVEAVVRAAVLNAEDWEVRESAARIATCDGVPIILIYGGEGRGKTTLACKFPKPVAMLLERGLPRGVSVDAIDGLASYNE